MTATAGTGTGTRAGVGVMAALVVGIPGEMGCAFTGAGARGGGCNAAPALYGAPLAAPMWLCAKVVGLKVGTWTGCCTCGTVAGAAEGIGAGAGGVVTLTEEEEACGGGGTGVGGITGVTDGDLTAFAGREGAACTVSCFGSAGVEVDAAWDPAMTIELDEGREGAGVMIG